MSTAKATPRDLRKRLLRLEAEAHRLEMLTSLQRLKNPMAHFQGGAPALLGLLGGGGGLGAAAAALLGRGRIDWVIKAIPLAMAGWRIAQKVRAMLAKRRRR